MLSTIVRTILGRWSSNFAGLFLQSLVLSSVSITTKKITVRWPIGCGYLNQIRGSQPLPVTLILLHCISLILSMLFTEFFRLSKNLPQRHDRFRRRFLLYSIFIRKYHRGMCLVVDDINLSRNHRKERWKQIFFPVWRALLGMYNSLKSIGFRQFKDLQVIPLNCQLIHALPQKCCPTQGISRSTFCVIHRFLGNITSCHIGNIQLSRFLSCLS